MTGYGPIDILWLDGGQVRPPRQDIQMDKLVAMARGFHPNLLVANRTAKEHEDFLTPEQKVLQQPDLDHVWESCMTMGERWAFTPNDKYKSAKTLIHTLVDVVAKGGNLLLNAGPQPDGRLPAEAVERLEEIGDWMAVCSEAIHDTRPWAPYRQGQWAFTQKKNNRYAIYLAEADLPAQLLIPGAQASRVTLVGLRDGRAIRHSTAPRGILLDIPASTRALPPCRHAFAFRLTSAV
jgi:alpha-L-fucosidase